MRKFFILFLSVVIVLSSFPFVGDGANFVKDMDVIFGNMELRVNGKKITGHRDPFLLDDSLYVPVEDLARGLDIKVGVNGNNISFDSSGRLGKDDYSSRDSLLFQSGYEILAKEKLIQAFEDELKALEGKESKNVVSKINPVWKRIRVGFGGVNVYLDGNKVNLTSQPLLYNGKYYVDLDSIAPYLYMTPVFKEDSTSIDLDSNGVLVSENYPNVEYLLGLRQGKNYLLDLQRAELENRRRIIEELKIPFAKLRNLAALEKYLRDNFGKIGDLELSLQLFEQNDRIFLDIWFPISKNNQWLKLNRADVESNLWNMYTAIINLYNEDASINGSIRNPYYTSNSNSKYRNYVLFQSKDKDVYFDFDNSRLTKVDYVNLVDLVAILKLEFNKYSGFNIDYEAEMSGDNVALYVYLGSDGLSKTSIFSKMGFLKVLNQRIRNEYPDLEIYGKVIYPGNIEPMDFYIKDGTIRSDSIMYETMEYIRNGFNSFQTENNKYGLEYSIYELSFKDYRLMVEGDFSINESPWTEDRDSPLDKLHSTVHGALSTIASLWDLNLSVDIVDKYGLIISDFDLHQNEVSMITASPSGGNIDYGEKVFLYTATSGADIYYTLDGSTPTNSSNLYVGGLIMTKDTTINAVGYKEGLNPSPVSTFTYTVEEIEDMSRGLTNLVVHPGSLSPSFSTNISEYVVNVEKDTEDVDIIPYGIYGVIKVDGREVNAGESVNIVLKSNTTSVTIGVKESNKAEMLYRLTIVRSADDNKYTMEDLTFSTLLNMLVFKGRIANSQIQDFSSYEIRLLTKTNRLLHRMNLDTTGSFKFDNHGLDPFDTLFGFKYEVIDVNGDTVLSGDLN